jgi:PleD family two-component response regulator
METIKNMMTQTGEFMRVLNRDLLLFLLDLEVKRARRYQNFFSILILKLVQSSSDHNGESLRICYDRLADLLTNEIRETDIIGSLGKDKLAVLLPYGDVSAGSLAMARIENLMNVYGFKSDVYSVVVQQICFPMNGTSALDIIKKAVGEETS